MEKWQRQKTTRVYLNPPKSERIITLWREGKLMLGEMRLAEGPSVPNYYREIACGIWPVYGKSMTAADFKTAKFTVRDDGIPIHTLENRFGKLNVTIEAFCDTERKSTAFVKYVINNNLAVSECFGLMLRTEEEAKLVFDAPDVYKSYAPDINVWKEFPSDFKQQGEILISGGYYLKPLSDGWTFDETNGVLTLNVEPNETKTFILALGKDEIPVSDYESQKLQSIAFYKDLLCRCSFKNGLDCPMVKSLTVQLLQCFNYAKDSEILLCRQGGLQRRMWPFEARYVLEALDRIGSFDDFIEPVIDLYFNAMQIETGEVVPLGIYWALATGVCIGSFADHSLKKGKEFYNKYREQVMKGFEFIKSTRVKGSTDPFIINGLFPPKQSCDSENVLQAWTMTDAHNVDCLGKLLKAAKHFGDHKASEIEKEYLDYRSCLQACYDKAKELSENDVITITNYVPGTGGDEKKHPFRPYYGTISSVLEVPEVDAFKMIRSLEQNNSRHEGLYARMPDHYRMHDEDGVVRMWYTTLDEIYWFDTFLRLGHKDKCREIIDSTIKYAMTDEFYMTERFHENDPWFTPWSPNASGNGRLIIMLDRLEN